MGIFSPGLEGRVVFFFDVFPPFFWFMLYSDLIIILLLLKGLLMDDNFDVKKSLEEITKQYDIQIEQIKMGRDIAKTILSSVSIIVSFVGSLTTLKESYITQAHLHNWLLVFSGLLFASLIIICVRLLLPVRLFGPIESSKKVYEEYVLGKNERETLLIIFSGYLNSIEKNEPKIKKRTLLIWIAGTLMILIVFCMILLLIIG